MGFLFFHSGNLIREPRARLQFILSSPVPANCVYTQEAKSTRYDTGKSPNRDSIGGQRFSINIVHNGILKEAGKFPAGRRHHDILTYNMINTNTWSFDTDPTGELKWFCLGINKSHPITTILDHKS